MRVQGSVPHIGSGPARIGLLGSNIGALVTRIGFLYRALYKGYYKGSIRVVLYGGLNN